MRRLFGHRVAAGVLVGLTLSLAGCGSPAAAPASSLGPLTGTVASSSGAGGASPSPSRSGTPDLAAPQPDPQISQPTAAGAEAAVRHYFALIDHATITGDVEPLLAQSTSDCRSCRYQVDEIQKVYDAGGSFLGGQSKVLQATTQSLDGKDHALVFAAVTRGSMTRLTSEVRQFPAVEGVDFLFSMAWGGGQWFVDGYEPLVHGGSAS